MLGGAQPSLSGHGDRGEARRGCRACRAGLERCGATDRGVAGGSRVGLSIMINLPAEARVLLATRPVDFRKGAHGLAAVAQEVLAEDPFSGTVIVYRSKRADRV